jgi:hypothetical protein
MATHLKLSAALIFMIDLIFNAGQLFIDFGHLSSILAVYPPLSKVFTQKNAGKCTFGRPKM